MGNGVGRGMGNGVGRIKGWKGWKGWGVME